MHNFSQIDSSSRLHYIPNGLDHMNRFSPPPRSDHLIDQQQHHAAQLIFSYLHRLNSSWKIQQISAVCYRLLNPNVCGACEETDRKEILKFLEECVMNARRSGSNSHAEHSCNAPDSPIQNENFSDNSLNYLMQQMGLNSSSPFPPSLMMRGIENDNAIKEQHVNPTGSDSHYAAHLVPLGALNVQPPLFPVIMPTFYQDSLNTRDKSDENTDTERKTESSQTQSSASFPLFPCVIEGPAATRMVKDPTVQWATNFHAERDFQGFSFPDSPRRFDTSKSNPQSRGELPHISTFLKPEAQIQSFQPTVKFPHRDGRSPNGMWYDIGRPGAWHGSGFVDFADNDHSKQFTSQLPHISTSDLVNILRMYNAGEISRLETKMKLHDVGSCKPCAFFHFPKKLCNSIKTCHFCHHEEHRRYSMKCWKRRRQRITKDISPSDLETVNSLANDTALIRLESAEFYREADFIMACRSLKLSVEGSFPASIRPLHQYYLKPEIIEMVEQGKKNVESITPDAMLSEEDIALLLQHRNDTSEISA